MSKKKNKTARTVKIIIFSILALPLLLIAVLIIFRNPIVDRIAEKYLSEINGAPVQIDGLKIALLKPGITIREAYVTSAKNPRIYAAKTGLLHIEVRIRPYLQEKLVSLPQIILEEIQFNVPKPHSATNSTPTVASTQEVATDVSDSPATQSDSGTASSSTSSTPSSPDANSQLLALISSIDTTAVIEEYASEMSTFSQLQTITRDVNSIQSDTDSTIRTVEQTITFLESQYNTISGALQKGTSDMQTAQNIVTQVPPLINQGKTMMTEISALQKKVAYYIQQINTYSNTLPQSIQNDTDYIAKKIADPTLLALDITIQIVEDLVSNKIAPYQAQLSTALNLLMTYRDTYIAKKEEEDTPKEDAFDFHIGTFRISIGRAANPIFILEAANITDRIYTSSTPTTFNVMASHDVFRIEGDGGIALHPNAPVMLTANLRYSGIPTHIEHLDLIELAAIDSVLDGKIHVTLATVDTGTATIGFVVKDTEATPIHNTQYGPYVADAIHTASPFDIDATIDFEDGAIDAISLDSEFFQRITEIIARILLTHIDSVLTELKAALTKEIRAYVDPILSQTSVSLEDMNLELLSEIENLEDVNQNINTLFKEANSQLAKIAEEQVKEEVEKLKQQIEDEAKKGIDTFKKSLPF